MEGSIIILGAEFHDGDGRVIGAFADREYAKAVYDGAVFSFERWRDYGWKQDSYTFKNGVHIPFSMLRGFTATELDWYPDWRD